jgi:hypothetical protein
VTQTETEDLCWPPRLEVVMGGKPDVARASGSAKSVRLDDLSYARVKMLATMQDCDFADAVNFLFDRLPRIRRAVDESIASGKKLGGRED